MTFTSALDMANISYTRTGDEIHLRCPFCAEQDYLKKTLSVNLKKGAANCFRQSCGFRSRTNTASKILRAFKLSNQFLDTETPAPRIESGVIHLPEGYQRLTCTEKLELEAEAVRYLLDRGLPREQICRKRVGVSLYGRYAYRVIFPAWRDKKLATFVSRDFTGTQEPKYLNAVTGKCVYNMPTKTTRAILSEGVFKALRIEQAFPTVPSGAILGNCITDDQVTQLCKAGVEQVTLWPDPDVAGRRGTVETAEKLTRARVAVDVVWPVRVPADEDKLLVQTGALRRAFSWGTAMLLQAR